jgi:hypothetical protein
MPIFLGKTFPAVCACIALICANACKQPSGDHKGASSTTSENRDGQEGKGNSKVTSADAPVAVGIEDGPGKGTKIEFPAGVLAVGSEVSVAVVDQPSEFAIDGVNEASPAIEVEVLDANGERVTSLPQPLTIAIPYGVSETLVAVDGVDEVDDNLCAVLSGDDGLFLWRRDALTLDDEAATASFNSKNVGVFQLVYCGDKPMEGFAQVDETGEVDESGVNGENPDGLVLTAIVDTAAYGGSDNHYCGIMFAESKEGSTIIGVGSAPVDGNVAEIKIGYDLALGNTEKGVLVAFASQSEGQDCDGLSVGTKIDESPFAYQRIFAAKYTAAELSAGPITATLGADRFAVDGITVSVGAPAASGFDPATINSTDLCIRGQGDEMFSEASAAIGSDGMINQASELSFLAGSSVPPDLEFEFGTVCAVKSGDATTADASRYALKLKGAAIGSFQYLAPVSIYAPPTLAAGLSCLEVALESSGNVFARINITVGQSNLLYLPWITESGTPKYDFTLHDGEDCTNSVFQNTAQQFPGVPLTGTMSLVL